jgi:hypothetical protein
MENIDGWLFFFGIILVFIIGRVSNRTLRNTRCIECGEKVSVFETKEEPSNNRMIVNPAKMLFTPNKYITRVQCKKCGNIQSFP